MTDLATRFSSFHYVGLSILNTKDVNSIWLCPVSVVLGVTLLFFSLFYGILAGYVARKRLFSAIKHGFVEESSLILPSLFVLGSCRMLGTNDILAYFVAGSTFAWDSEQVSSGV